MTPIFLLDGTVATDNLEKEFVFEISPNPASSIVFVKYSNLKSADLRIRVYNVMGKEVFEKNVTSGVLGQQISIDVSEWARGVYFLKGKIEGKEVVEKIVVE